MTNAQFGSAIGIGTVADNELPPVVYRWPKRGRECRRWRLNFTVNLSGASTLPVSVGYASADVTATNTLDYSGVAGTFNFAPGETSKTLTVPVLDDALAEGDETFTITLSSPVNATVSPSPARVRARCRTMRHRLVVHRPTTRE